MNYDFFRTEIKVNDKISDCLLFSTRHNNELKKKYRELGYTVFDIRHSDEDFDEPISIENAVVVNFWGYIAIRDKEVIQAIDKIIKENGFFEIYEDMFRSEIFAEAYEIPEAF